MSDNRIDGPDSLSFIKEITKNVPTSADARRNAYILLAGVLASKVIKNAKRK